MAIPHENLPKIDRRSLVFLLLGTVALFLGCYRGLQVSGDTATEFAVFVVSIVFFAVAIMFSLQASRKLISSAAFTSLQPDTKAEMDLHPDRDTERSSPSTVKNIVVPLSNSTNKATLLPVLSDTTTLAQSPKQARLLIDSSSQTTPNLATLMRSPLSDLLLAAVCKDPVGAKILFEQALSQQGFLWNSELKVDRHDDSRTSPEASS